ncbi:MAG: glutamyl-tRNA reductase [Deltaproteobacteria bacterium]|nr:glutamyl-tRNA reductase [Deltaproteobacteria bacterium]
MTPKLAIRTSQNLTLVGISYHEAPLEILEGLALSNEEIVRFYQTALKYPELINTFVLSTCNRTELYGFGDDTAYISALLIEILHKIVGDKRFPGQQFFYLHYGQDSLHHLARVAASLDAMILGEAQIFGQVKAAYKTSISYKAAEPAFARLMQAVFTAAKRARSETEIGRGVVSIASAAVHVASRFFNNLTQQTVVVVGAGENSRLMLQHFYDQNPQRIIIINRTFDKAQRIAKTVGGEAWPWTQLTQAVSAADVLACAVRLSEPVIDGQLLAKAMENRSARSLLVLDLGLPRNVTPHNHHSNVFINDLEAFHQVVDENLGRRKMEVSRVEAIIDEEIDKLHNDEHTAQIKPFIIALRTAIEQMRKSETLQATLGLNANETAAVDRATTAVTNKLLHLTTESIKAFANQQANYLQIKAVTELMVKLKETNLSPTFRDTPYIK